MSYPITISCPLHYIPFDGNVSIRIQGINCGICITPNVIGSHPTEMDQMPAENIMSTSQRCNRNLWLRSCSDRDWQLMTVTGRKYKKMVIIGIKRHEITQNSSEAYQLSAKLQEELLPEPRSSRPRSSSCPLGLTVFKTLKPGGFNCQKAII